MMTHHPAPHTAKPSRTAPALAWSNPAAHAHVVRIPDAMLGANQAERLARLLVAMEAAPAVDFDVQPRTQRRVTGHAHQPVVRIQLDGWLYFLATDDAGLLAACLRADHEALGGNSALTDLVATAIVRCADEAVAMAAVQNAELAAGVA